MRKWITNGIALFQNTRAFNIFSWEEKGRVKIFFYYKRIWKIEEKIKFWFIQKPWIYLLVKSRNPQILYIINIMNFSKFVQKIYFYLLVASLYPIQSKLKIFIHSIISSQFACPNEWFQIELFWKKNITKRCIFESKYFFWR